MIKGYKDFYYNVQDMKRSVEFYKAAFGMQVGPQGSDEYWTLMVLGNLNLGLHGTGGEKVPALAKDKHGPHCGGTLTFQSDNILEDRAKIEKCGGKVLMESKEHWGHMLVFEDLDSNVLKLMHPTY